jgi:hypothetical protein
MEEEGRNRPSGGRGEVRSQPFLLLPLVIRMKGAKSFMAGKVVSSE